MAREEDTEEGRIRRIIGEEVTLPKKGIITEVYEHTQKDDRWNFHVDVRLSEEKEPRRVPVAVPMPELAAPPRPEDHPDGPDMALVQFFDDDQTDQPVVTNILYNNKDRPPLGESGIVRLRRGSLYFEMEPSGDWARLAQKPDDDKQPSIKIEIDDKNGEINIETGGEDVNIKSGGGNMTLDSEGGDVKVMEGGTPKPVAVEDHTHDFTYEGGGDNSSTLSGTTATENEKGTDTEIE